MTTTQTMILPQVQSSQQNVERHQYGTIYTRATMQDFITEHSASVQVDQEQDNMDDADDLSEQDIAWLRHLESVENPCRGIPPFRPLNTNVDLSTRPTGSRFQVIMLGGVWAAGVIRAGWRAVGEPGKELFRYDIGGDF